MIFNFIDVVIIIFLFFTALFIPKKGTDHKIWMLVYFGIVNVVQSIYLLITNIDTLVFLQEYIIPCAGFICSILLVIWLIKINKKGNEVQ